MNRLGLILVLLPAACGERGTTGIDGGDAPPETATEPDGSPLTTQRLVSSPYTIPAYTEMWQCERVNVTQDLWVTRFSPNSPLGTHHTVLAIDPTPGAPGTSDCGISIDTNWIVLFASGVGSPALDMPPGVAFRIPSGSQLVFDLHLLNAGASPLAGESWIDVATVLAADVRDEAQLVLAGPVTFSIPPGTGQTINGGCTISRSTNFFAVFPHMHQLGVHVQVTARTSLGGTQIVYDMPYSFNDQRFAAFAPISMQSGDRIGIACTYDNTTGGPVAFGESSNQEMCFAISYLYPATGTTLGAFCAF